jgi:hypothetical protein
MIDTIRIRLYGVSEVSEKTVVKKGKQPKKYSKSFIQENIKIENNVSLSRF